MQSKKYNVLMITVDDLNYDSTGIFGCEVNNITPHIDSLASQGMLFRNAHVSVAVCQPSRQVLMTGRYPHNNGALGFDPINDDVPTLQERLKSAGYINGIIGKEDHLAPTSKYCWDFFIRTLDQETGYGRNPQKYYELTSQFLKTAKTVEKPFFLMANSHDPHRPFAGSSDEGMGGTPVSRTYTPDEISVPGFLPDIPDVRKELAQYYTSVHRADEIVGQILKSLDESGMADETIVMFLSDNGMAFPFAKSNCYLSSTRTPWIVRWPSVIRSGIEDNTHFISGIDYTPTILDALGLPEIEGVDGRSFLPLLKGKTQEGRDSVFTLYNNTAMRRSYPMRALQNKKYGYIYNAWSDSKTVFKVEAQLGLTWDAMVKASETDSKVAERVDLFEYRVPEELYDMELDPNCLQNLIDKSEYSETVQAMRSELLMDMQATNDSMSENFSRYIESCPLA